MSDNMENTEEIRSIIDKLKEQTETKTDEKVEVLKEVKDSTPDDLKKMLMKQYGIKKNELMENSLEKDDYSVDTEGFSNGVEEQTVEKQSVEEPIVEEQNVEEQIIEEPTVEEEIEQAEEVSAEECLPEETKEDIDVSMEQILLELEETNDTSIDDTSKEEKDEFDSLKQYPQITFDEIENGRNETASETKLDEAVIEKEKHEEIKEEKKLGVDDLFSNLKNIEIEEKVDEPKKSVITNELSQNEIKIDEVLSEVVNEKETEVEPSNSLNLDLEDDPSEIYNTVKLYTENVEKTEQQKNFEKDGLISKPDNFDDTDIKLLVSLGEENALTKTLGLERVQKALKASKIGNEHILRKREVFGCNGEEYALPEDEGRIRRRYQKEKYISLLQTSITALITVFLFLYEIIGKKGIGLFNEGKNITGNIVFGLCLLTLCALLSINNIKRSFKSLLNFASVASFTSYGLFIVNVINDLALIIGNNTSNAITYHTLSAILFLYTGLSEYLSIRQQESAFSICSGDLMKTAIEPIKNKNESEEVESSTEFTAEKSDFVGNYFERTSRPSGQALRQLIMLILSLAVSIIAMISLILFKVDRSIMLNGFLLTSTLTIGVSTVFCMDYAFYYANKLLKRKRATFLGIASIDEYRDIKKITLNDVDVFEKNGVRTKGLKVYDNSEIYKVLYNASAVFSAVGGPLKSVFEYATSEMKRSDKVRICTITENGISAIVDEKTSVLIGSAIYMKEHNIPYRYTDNDKKAEETAEGSITYISLNGNMSAKLYASYRLSKRFDEVLKELSDNDISVDIRSADPSLNNRWATITSDFKNVDLSVSRPELKDIKHYYKVSDSSIISNGNSLGVAHAVAYLERLINFERLQKKISLLSLLFSAILSIILIITTKGSPLCLYISFAFYLILIGVNLFLSRYFIKNSRK